MPTDPLGALVAWVENGTAPDTLPAMKMSANFHGRHDYAQPVPLPVHAAVQGLRGRPTRPRTGACVTGPNQQVLEELTASETSVLAEAASSAVSVRTSIAAALLPAALLALALVLALDIGWEGRKGQNGAERSEPEASSGQKWV